MEEQAGHISLQVQVPCPAVLAVQVSPTRVMSQDGQGKRGQQDKLHYLEVCPSVTREASKTKFKTRIFKL